MFVQEYLSRLQAQKSGGAGSFGFLDTDEKTVGGAYVDVDMGFKASQIAALDDTIQVCMIK
jgi:hypothetical protein